MAWDRTLRAQVLREFVIAAKTRGARQHVADPMGLEPEPVAMEEQAVHPLGVPDKKRRIVTRRAA